MRDLIYSPASYFQGYTGKYRIIDGSIQTQQISKIKAFGF